MADFVSTLVEMGFDKDKAAAAVEKTGNRGVDAAMDWILSNPDAPEGSGGSAAASSVVAEGGGSAETKQEEAAVPKSWKCEDCGKLFNSMDTVEFHAAKTNHSNFSESTEEKKPLSPEEKAEQQKKMMELMKLKRAEREEREKREELEREKQRMSSGKEMLEMKRRMEEQEMKQLVEQRKKEKMEDKMARDRVKAMIEADRLARKAKFGGGGAETPPAPSPVASVQPVVKEEVPQVKKDYTETKLQIRLPTGKTLTQTFKVHEPLAAVRVFVEVNRDDGVTGGFSLMTNFPRRVFQGDDYDAPLQALGLVPSAVIMVTKS